MTVIFHDNYVYLIGTCLILCLLSCVVLSLWELDKLEKNNLKWRTLIVKLQDEIRVLKVKAEMDGRYMAFQNHLSNSAGASCCCAEHYGDNWYAGSCPGCKPHMRTDEEQERLGTEYVNAINIDLDAEINELFDREG